MRLLAGDGIAWHGTIKLWRRRFLLSTSPEEAPWKRILLVSRDRICALRSQGRYRARTLDHARKPFTRLTLCADRPPLAAAHPLGKALRPAARQRPLRKAGERKLDQPVGEDELRLRQQHDIATKRPFEVTR